MTWPTLSTHTSVQCTTHEQLNNIPQLHRYVGNTLDTFNFRQEDVQEKLNHLNLYHSTRRPDLLQPRVLRTLEDMLYGSINHIFNKSAETKIITADWKTANVTAIHKKGNRQEPVNYRPMISLASVVCQRMGRLIGGRQGRVPEPTNFEKSERG